MLELGVSIMRGSKPVSEPNKIIRLDDLNLILPQRMRDYDSIRSPFGVGL
jgi:hypothetical protein